MGFLDNLPGEIQFSATLAPITGDAAAGTGLAGVLKLLESLAPASASSFLTSRLDASLSASLRVGGSGLTGDVEGIYKHGAHFMTPMPGHFDYDLRVEDMDAAGVDLAGKPWQWNVTPRRTRSTWRTCVRSCTASSPRAG